jgi:hypothetical protein
MWCSDTYLRIHDKLGDSPYLEVHVTNIYECYIIIDYLSDIINRSNKKIKNELTKYMRNRQITYGNNNTPRNLNITAWKAEDFVTIHLLKYYIKSLYTFVSQHFDELNLTNDNKSKFAHKMCAIRNNITKKIIENLDKYDKRDVIAVIFKMSNIDAKQATNNNIKKHIPDKLLKKNNNISNAETINNKKNDPEYKFVNGSSSHGLLTGENTGKRYLKHK